MTEHDEAVMSAETLDQMERCYKNWNGSAVMEAAFSKLLAEVKRLRTKAAPEISEAMVERALSAYWELPEGKFESSNRRDMRAALTAALTQKGE